MMLRALALNHQASVPAAGFGSRLCKAAHQILDMEKIPEIHLTAQEIGSLGRCALCKVTW